MDVTAAPLPRHQFPLAGEVAYLNTALMSPLPVAAAEAMAADAERAGRRGSGAYEARWAEAERVRGRAAALLGASVEDVAFVPSTTAGLGLVATGLDWRAGDRVIVASGDHPATTGPWRAQARHGVAIDEVEAAGPAGALPLDGFARALEAGRGRVRVVAVSWVQAHSGWRTDLAALAALAHDHGALLCVDAIQGVGVVPCHLAAWGVDAAAAGAQKWMLGPHGIGLAYLAPGLRERLAVAVPGAPPPPDAGGPDPGTSARAHEAGALNHAGLAGLGAALDLLAAPGPEAVWSWVDDLARRLAEGLAALGATVRSGRDGDERSALVSVALPGLTPLEARDRLAVAGVVAAPRGEGLRFSPHAWNDRADVATALAAVAAL